MSGQPPGPGRQLGARAVHRVTPADVRARVSIRHLPDGPDGPATDVVGRLLGYEAGMLVLVDRAGQLVTVGEHDVVASRVVPEHPRLPPEPDDLGTEDRPLTREAARVLLLDPDGRVLLVSHRQDATRRVWTAPGGGLHPDEDHAAAARRELVEELGLDLDLGPCVFTRQVRFRFAGVWLDQRERWFLCHVDGYDPRIAPLDDVGNDEARWWSLDELRTTDAVIAPAALADHLAALHRDGPPDAPIDVGR